MGNWTARSFALLFAFFALVWAAPAARAQDEMPSPNGPVFLIVSLDEGGGFDTDFSDETASDTVIVNIGTLQGGGSLRDVTFLSAALATIPLPYGQTLEDLNGHLSTIVGSYQTSEEESHIVTPQDPAAIEGGIPPEIQVAVFLASPALAAEIDLANEGNPFLTTEEIASFIAGYEYTETYNAEQIAGFLFGGAVPISFNDAGATPLCEAEGELFPHDPDEPILSFAFSFDEDGNLSYDVCLLVDVEVKESSVNLKKKGTVSVAIYSSDTFDSGDIDDSLPVEIGGVAADKVHFASNKATAQFSVEKLVKEGVLTSTTKEVTIHATLTDGSCIEGTAPINVK